MKLLNEIIALPDRYSLTPEATSYVAGLMMESQGIEVVDSPQSQQHAVTMGREFRKHLSEVELTRKQLKEPILNAGRLIDSLASAHCQPMKDELPRLEALVGAFQLAEQRRVEQEEAARQAQLAWIAEERAKAEQQVQIRATAQAVAELEAAQALEDSAIVAPLPEPVKAVGAATGQRMVIEVTDLKALYLARPDLCRLEVNLAAIRASCVPELPIPGLRLSWTTKTTIRK